MGTGVQLVKKDAPTGLKATKFAQIEDNGITHSDLPAINESLFDKQGVWVERSNQIGTLVVLEAAVNHGEAYLALQKSGPPPLACALAIFGVATLKSHPR